MNELDLALCGRALEHGCSIASKWTAAIKYSGVAVHTDTQESSDRQHTLRHTANVSVSNVLHDVRRLGKALRLGRHKKAVRIAKIMLLEPVPPRAEWSPPVSERGRDIEDLATGSGATLRHEGIPQDAEIDYDDGT